MPIDHFRREFGLVYINYDPAGLWRDDWLILDDRTNSPGEHKKCGETCTRHEFTVRSEVRQQVILSANVWDYRDYPTACKQSAVKMNPDGNKRHVFGVPGFAHEDSKKGNEFTEWNSGSREWPPIMMDAGEEVDFFVELDYTRRDMSNDFSSVVWGDKGPVTLTHKGGIPGMHFPTL